MRLNTEKERTGEKVLKQKHVRNEKRGKARKAFPGMMSKPKFDKY